MGDDMKRSVRSAPPGYGAKDSSDSLSSSTGGILRTVKSACDTVVSYIFAPSSGAGDGGGTDGTGSSRESDNAAMPPRESLAAASKSPRGKNSSRSSSACIRAREDAEIRMSEEEKRRLVSALGVLLRGPYRPMFTGDPSRRLPVGGVVTSIPHCRQLETWDCGIACIQMLLRWLRDDGAGQVPAILDDTWGAGVEMTLDERTERKWMLDNVETESVWTIDLVIALERLLDKDQRELFDFPTCRRSNWDNVSASYLFCSTKLSVNESYNAFGYYRNAFSKDEARVTKRFALAKETDLPMLCLSKLEMSGVLDVVSRENCVAVVLLDNRILVCPDKSQQNEARKKPRISSDKADIEFAGTGNIQGIDMKLDFLAAQKKVVAPTPDDFIDTKASTVGANKKQANPGDDRAYAGHYVLLCGLSTSPDDIARAESQGEGLGSNFCLVIKNPGSLNSTDFVTPSHFERAWRASGTDDDIIFISKHNAR